MDGCKRRRPLKVKGPQLPEIERLPPETWPVLDEYLTALIAQAHRAANRAGAAEQLDDTGCYAAMAAYWKNATGAFRWFRGQLRRQVAEHVKRNAPAERG